MSSATRRREIAVAFRTVQSKGSPPASVNVTSEPSELARDAVRLANPRNLISKHADGTVRVPGSVVVQPLERSIANLRQKLIDLLPWGRYGFLRRSHEFLPSTRTI